MIYSAWFGPIAPSLVDQIGDALWAARARARHWRTAKALRDKGGSDV